MAGDRVVYRRLEISAETKGVEQAVRQMERVGDSIDMAARSANQANFGGAASSIKAATGALDGYVSHLREIQTESGKTAVMEIKRAAGSMRDAQKLRMQYDEGFRNATKYAQVEASVANQIEARNLTIEQGNAILASAGRKFKQYADDASAANDNFRHGILGSNSALGDHRRSLAETETRLGRIKSAFGAAAETFGKFRAISMGALGAAGLGGGLAALGGGLAVGDVVNTSAEFQKLGASLKTVTGSADAAQRAFAYIKQFAAETPYTLQDVTEAFIKLQGLGLDPSRKALESYGNTASAMGKPLMQFIEAVADATTGEFERLKEFGITAKQQNDQVAFTFQGTTTVIGKNADAIEGYLRKIGQTKFAGGMAEQMKILPGVFANASDAIDNFKNAIGEGGLSAAIGAATSRFTDFLNSNTALATSIGGVLGDAVVGFGKGVEVAVSALTELYRWGQATVEVAGGMIGAFSNGGQQIASVASGMVTGAEAFATAWTASGKAIYDVLNSIIGAGVGAYQSLIATWDQLPVAFAALAKSAGNALIAGLETAVNGAIAGVNKLIEGINGVVPDFAQMKPFEGISLDGFKADLTGVQQAAGNTIASIMSAAQATDYLGAGMDALTAPAKNAAEQIAAAKARIDEASKASADLGTTTKLTGEGFKIAGADAKDAATAAGGAAAGLKDAQRVGSRMKLDDGFRRGADAADDFRDHIRGVGDEMQTFSDIAKDAFGSFFDAVGRGEGVGKSLINVFANIGRQMASNGADKLFDWLTGKTPTASAPNMAPVTQLANAMSSIGSGRIGSDYAASGRSSGGNELASSLRWAADKLGTSARDLATVISYETGGTFSTSKRGGAGGKHLGLIQFGPEEQKQYGVTIGQGIADQMKSVVSYLQDRGFKQGMGLLDLYSTINAGRPGRYNASDAGNGGAPGTVADKVNYQMGGHQRNADRLLGADNKSMTQSVSDGYIDGNKRIAGGAIPGLQPSAKAQGMLNAGWDGFSNPGGGRGAAGMQALGSAFGIFSQGVQSQSPIGGALGGIMGGFEAGSALGPLLGLTSLGGPIGAGIGAVVGLIGGIFGKSKAKKQAKKQKRDQARASWDQNKTALRELQDHITDTVRGSMSQDFMTVDENIAQFAALAKDTKRADDKSTVAKMQKDSVAYKARVKQLFRDTFEPVTEDLAKGLGLDSDFSKARDAVQKTAESYRAFINDTELAFENPGAGRYNQILATYEASKKSIESAAKDKSVEVYGDQGKFKGYETVKGIGATEAAKQLAEAAKKRDDALAEYQRLYGDVLLSREEAIRKATEAAREGLLRIVSGDVVEQTDVDKALDQSRGAAASLAVQLTKLGMTAEEAGVAIDKALADRLKRLKKDFEDNLTSQINDLSGTGYINQFEDLVKEYKDLMADAGKIGADPSLVTRYFELAAQDIANGADLSTAALADLVKQFPELADVVGKFGSIVSSKVVQDGLKSFLDDRLAEATQKRVDAESELISTFKESESQVKSFRENIADFLEGLKFDDGSTLSQKDQVAEAARIFRETAAKAGDTSLGAEDRNAAQDKMISVAGTYRDELREYFASSTEYADGVKEIENVLTSTGVKAQSQLDLQREQVSKLVDLTDTAKSIDEAIKALTDAIKVQKELQDKVDGGRSFGKNPERNRLIDAGIKQLGFNFTGNYGVGANGIDEFYDWRRALPVDQLRAVEAVIAQYIGINRQMGGLIPGYVNGGVVGNGVWNKDSVLARYAGGGAIGLAGGEFVVSAPKVTPRTYPVLDAINRGAMPTNDNRALIDEVSALRAELRALHGTTGAGLQRTAEAQERTAAASEDAASTARRRVA